MLTAQVANPLDVHDRVEQRRDEPQVAGDRALARQQAEDALVHVEVAAVDAVVALDHHHGQLGVALQDRFDRLVQRRPT